MDTGELKVRHEGLERRFKSLDAERLKHVRAAEACSREMIKVEGAWEELGSLLAPAEKGQYKKPELKAVKDGDNTGRVPA